MPIYRDYLTIHGWDSEGDPAEYCFWTGEDNVTVNVTSAVDGSTDSRDFVGDGALPENYLGDDALVDAIGLEARTIEIQLNHLNPQVEAMLRAGRIRTAVVEIQRGELDADTYALADDPAPIFLGRVDGASIERAAAGGEGRAVVAAVSDVVELSRTNPALKSDETQKLRSDDRFRRYADSAASVEVWWGQAKGTAGGV